MEHREINTAGSSVAVLETDPKRGLTQQEADLRTQHGLGNKIIDLHKRTAGQIIARKCLTFFNLLFLVMAVLLMIAGSSVKNLTFMVIVIFNTFIGCVQEIRAKRAVDKLTLVAAQTVKVLRDGKFISLRSDLLVRDDVVEFSAGDQICADAVVCDGQLQVNEALVTGEADAIEKSAGDTLLSGSFVVAGRGKARLTHVGNASFAAKLAAEAKKNPKVSKPEMMRSLDRLIRVVGIALVPIGAVLFYQGFADPDLSLRENAEGTVAALVGMVPEGLYLLTSLALAASAIKLSRKKVLVQDMNCIENLARVDVLCVDKTGTITEPVMEVENVLPLTQDSPERLEKILNALYGCREPENDTGRAIAEMFPGECDWNCTRYIPFTSDTKWSSATFEDHGTFIAGAPEFIMGSRYGELEETVHSWAVTGHRVLLVAQYNGDPDPKGLLPEKLTPLALILLANRVRPDAAKTFAFFAEQGVTIKVISGDDPVTVSTVAQRVGIANAHRYVDTSTLETEEDFLAAVEQYAVFGRVTPEKKRSLIRALKKQKHTVAMTGDGVNDVLALKEADCSIAMASGAQAASQIAKLVLLKSDFSAMPSIVDEGRRVINNIQRTAALFLVKNIFAIGLSLLSVFTGWAYPLIPLHMSIISGLTIGVPSFFLAMEPNHERVQGKFLPSVMRRAFPAGLCNIIVILLAQAFTAIFALPSQEMSTVCTAILAVVGMAALFQICMPFDKFRWLIWGLMAAALTFAFTVLADLLELKAGNEKVQLVALVLLALAPAVFLAMRYLFILGEKIVARLTPKKKRKSTGG